jgi:transcription initiation factor TFIID subunit 7
LVDLPCIIESQKTLDNQHLFKVADISQMLLVEKAVKDESTITKDPLIIDDYIWPHGITPPLRHVRKRRFRKRLSRQTIEVVEEKVDELLKAEEGCESVETSESTSYQERRWRGLWTDGSDDRSACESQYRGRLLRELRGGGL